MRCPFLTAVSFASVLLLTARSAAAHGLGGQRYDLPLPLELYLGGAAAVVAVSFLVVAVFAWRRPGFAPVPARRWRLAGARVLASGLVRYAVLAARAAALALFVLTAAAGLLGNQNPVMNLAPVSVWVLGWVGVAFASALIGDVWRFLNPFDAVFRLLETATGIRAPGRRMPRHLGMWPAVALFLVFAWAELVWPARDHPRALAVAMLLYAAMTWTGMWVYGRRTWLLRAEVFAAAFGLLVLQLRII